MTFFDKLRELIFTYQNRVRSMFLECLKIVEGGGPVIGVFLSVYLDGFRKSSSCVMDFGIIRKLYLDHHHFITV